MKKIGLFLATLINLTTFAPAMDHPLGLLQQLPIEITDQLGVYLTPKDVLSFQETCKMVRGEWGVRMMTIASMNYPVFLDWEFYPVSVGDVSDAESAHLDFIQGYIPDLETQNIILRKPWQVLSGSFCQLLGIRTPFVEKLININKSGVLKIDLTLNHIDAYNLSLIIPYLKNVRSLKFKFSGYYYKMTSKHLELLSNNKENITQLMSIKIDSAEKLFRSALAPFQKDFEVFDPIGYDTHSRSVLLVRKKGKRGYAK